MSEARERSLGVAARYLGIRGKRPPSPEERALLEAAYEEMLAVAHPKHRLLYAPVSIEEGGDGEGMSLPLFCFEGLPPVPSRDLSRLFAGCDQGLALLATLGMELDLQVRRLMVTDPALAAAVSACGSAHVDAYIDDVLAQEAARLRVTLTPRFSPGYGDVSLDVQPALLSLLGAGRLGVSLTESLLMIPEKSVSALMGVLAGSGTIQKHGCGDCGQGDCPYREER